MTNDDDRRAAAEIERDALALWPDIAEQTASLTLAGKRDKSSFVRAFTAHRLAAFKAGQETERAEIVAALRDMTRPGANRLDVHYADAIERGDRKEEM